MDVGKRRRNNSATLAAKPATAEPKAASFLHLCPSGHLVDGKLAEKPPRDQSNELPASSRLLDVYEIACITRELNRLLLRASAAAQSPAAFAGSRRPPENEVRGLRGFLVRQALAFCGPDGGCSIVFADGNPGDRRRSRASGSTGHGRTGCKS